jgi:hypothetical protein
MCIGSRSVNWGMMMVWIFGCIVGVPMDGIISYWGMAVLKLKLEVESYF